MTKSAEQTPLLAAPASEVRWRSFFKSVIKSGMLLGRNVQALGTNLFADTVQLYEEAKAELDRERASKANEAAPGRATKEKSE